MERYENRQGNSGVRRYEIRPHAIVLEFAGGELYLYDESKPGRAQVEQMKKLARAGSGLSTYVSRFVRENYARKL